MDAKTAIDCTKNAIKQLPTLSSSADILNLRHDMDYLNTCLTALELLEKQGEGLVVEISMRLPNECSMNCAYWEDYSRFRGWCGLFHEILEFLGGNRYKKCDRCFAHGITRAKAEAAMEG